MKCLWHPLKKKGISLRERPSLEALGRSKSKGKDFVANPQGKPIVGKGKREAPKTNYVMGKTSIYVEDEQENTQVPSLKRSKKNNPEVGSGVGGVFASLVGASEKTFTGSSCSPWR
jgi:hypothetical protein